MHNVPRDAASHLVMAQGPAVVYGHFVKAVNHPAGGGGRGQQSLLQVTPGRWGCRAGGRQIANSCATQARGLFPCPQPEASHDLRLFLRQHRWEVDDRPAEKMPGVSGLNRKL